MSPEGFRALRLDEAQGVPVALDRGALTWLPIRRPLGIRAFGMNAYRAAEVGQLVVEPHAEGTGHEEVYVVLTGRAQFTLGGEDLDAPAGTVVFLPAGEVRREAVAVEPGTTVLAVGGWPDRPFAPSAWESWFLAEAAADRGAYEEARAALDEGLREQPDHPRILLHRARVEVRAGDLEEALRWARRAAETGDETVSQQLIADEDLAPLRQDPRFAAVRERPS